MTIEKQRLSLRLNLTLNSWCSCGRGVVLCVLSLVVFLSSSPTLSVQRVIRGGVIRGGFDRGPVVRGVFAEETKELQEDSEGAGLKTDPELESILKKADQFREEGNYRLAAKYWQAVLEKSGDSLFSADGKTYYSLGNQVESMIAKLPAEGLQMYRITADAKAKEILAEARTGDRIAGLSKVVKEYFISSDGDDAAFELASHSLDNFDFVGAIRLYRKIIDNYPDPSVRMEQVWLRLALAYSYVGNKTAAEDAIKKAEEISDGSTDRQFKAILSATQNADAYVKSSGAEKIWSLRLGNTNRTGLMPTFPLDLLDQDLKPIWSYGVAPNNNKTYDRQDVEGDVQMDFDPELKSDESELVRDWAKYTWHPAGELLFDNQRVFFKTPADITAWSKAADSEEVLWRPMWLNQFNWDGASGVWKQLTQYNQVGKMARNDYPNTFEKAFHFGDRIHQSMAMHNSVLYSIEGKEYSDGETRSRNKTGNYSYGNMPRRTRSNFLTAYNAVTGQFKWRYPPLGSDSTSNKKKIDPAATDSEDDAEIGFMAAPITYGNLLLVPVNNGGSIWVYALDAENDGKRVWKSFLCDEPSTGSNEWAEILMTIEGSDLYVNCGYGAFFVLDPATGSVRFARRYKRTGSMDSSVRNAGIQGTLMTMDGFDHDILLPYGNQVILLASDHNMLAGFNRQNGAKIWEAPAKDIFGTSVNYLIGVHDGVLYAGGFDNVVAYDIDGEGRMLWTIEDALNGQSCGGRAMLTTDGVFVPVGQTIMQFDLKTGELLKRVGVRLHGRSPVGNLYSDGEKLWLHNGSRILALGKSDDEVPEKDDSEKSKNKDDKSDDDDSSKDDTDKK